MMEKILRSQKGNQSLILNKGFVAVIDSLGSDLTIVNSARVSFGKEKKVLEASDEALIKYLILHKHYSPFRHIVVQFHIKAPEFVMRQWYKHVVGCEWTSSYPTKDHAWNELSLRYVEVSEYYRPSLWRGQSEDNKQASEGLIEEQTESSNIYSYAMAQMFKCYQDLLRLGVAKEQARILLPLAVYTEVYWTASFQAIMNFVELRMEEHAQWEIQEYAREVLRQMKIMFPITTDLWLEYNQK